MGRDSARLERIRRYRWTMYACIVVGTLGFVGATRLDRPLVGVAVYWTGIAGFLAVWRGTSVTLFDERDKSLERRAGAITLCLVGAAGVVGGSALFVLVRLRDIDVPPEVEGALYAWAVVFGVFGVVYLGLKYRP
ncbi:MAG: hypothetical protein ABEJ68_04830 [Halobacteriaceae archaeon]